MMKLAHEHHHKLAVAPMMDWTDRHCRVFHRMLAPSAMLYTEMVTADAILHGDRDRLLSGHHQHDGDAVVLQLGGSDPETLAAAIKLAQPYNYTEYNLNVGCPSDRVKSGRFGACLMAEPLLVAACTQAMIEASAGRPVSVKCRIGIDEMDIEADLDNFIRMVAESGVSHFIIHARKAWLNGLSPKENRTIPPLNYDRVIRLKESFPELCFSLNGGITTADQASDLVAGFAGVMIGRAAYQSPHELALMAEAVQGNGVTDRFGVARAMADYAEKEQEKGTRLIAISRHMLGLMSGLPGAKAWRRALSEEARAENTGPDVIRHATDILEAKFLSHQDAA